MDFSKLIARARGMLLSPATEWPAAAAETDSVKRLYLGYIMALAAIPPLFHFLKGSLIGYSLFGVTVRTPVGRGIAGMIVAYALSLVMTYVMALIINALAASFGGTRNPIQALKSVAYAWTAYWIAGIAAIVPWLGVLILLAGGVYSIYLLYVGLPHTMQCPQEKSAGYTAVSVIIAVVLGWILALIVGTITAVGAIGSGFHASDSGSSVSVDKDSALGQLAAMSQRMQAASRKAQRSGKPEDTAQAMGAAMNAIAGGNAKVQALTTGQLKAFLPDSVGTLRRTSASAQRSQAMGMQISTARAGYADADNRQQINVTITDAGGSRGLLSMASAFGMQSERETDTGYEKTYKRDGRTVHEQWDNQSHRGEYALIVGSRFTLRVSGHADSIDQLKDVAGHIDLDRLESLKDAGVSDDG